MNRVRLASFDPGIVNCGVTIASFQPKLDVHSSLELTDFRVEWWGIVHVQVPKKKKFSPFLIARKMVKWMEIFIRPDEIDCILVENQSMKFRNRISTCCKILQNTILQFGYSNSIFCSIIAPTVRLRFVLSESGGTGEHKTNKKSSVNSVEMIIKNNSSIFPRHLLEIYQLNKKKDDIADSFLQMWAVVHRLK